jgi:hypothetical protein
MGRTTFLFTLAHAAAAGLLAVLAACGGGGSDGPSGPTVSKDVARTASENVIVPSDSSQAMSSAMSAARFIVGAGGLSVTVPCAAGGSATYEIVAGPTALFGNHRFDDGEQYSVTFSNCRSSSDGSLINGNMQFTVVDASGENYTAVASHDLLVQQRPQRTTRLNGASTLVHTELVSGSGRTTTDRWTAGSISVVATKGSRTNSFSLRNVDLTRTEVADNSGTVTSRHTTGSCTLVAVIDGTSLNFVWQSDGDLKLGVDGVPTDGAWSLFLPNNVIGVEIESRGPLRILTVSVDWFGNGSIDLPIFFIDFDDLL